MKNKKLLISFFFIFSLFFSNLIPYVTPTIQLGGLMNNEIEQLLNLLTSSSLTQYFTVLFHVFILFITLWFLIKNGCTEWLRILFTFGFVGLVLLNLSTNALMSNINYFASFGSVEVLDTYRTIVETIQWINVGLIVVLGITLVLIFINIRTSLKCYVAMIIASVILTLGLIAPTVIVKIMESGSNSLSSLRLLQFNAWSGLISLFTLIIFKVFLINEVIHQVTIKENISEMTIGSI